MAEADVLPFEGVESDSLVRAGEKLRVARESRGLSLDALSQQTKINGRYLEAIETSDFAALPARIYAVGFARSYAAALGLDGAALAAQVRTEVMAQEQPSIARQAYDLDLDDPAKVPSRSLAWIAAGLGLALLVAGAFLWRSYFAPAAALPPVSEETLATVAAPEFSPTAAISPTAESAAGMPSPLTAEPAGAAPAAPAPASGEAPRAVPSRAAAGAKAAQRLPTPVQDQLRPVPEPSAAPVAEPAIAPQAD